MPRITHGDDDQIVPVDTSASGAWPLAAWDGGGAVGANHGTAHWPPTSTARQPHRAGSPPGGGRRASPRPPPPPAPAWAAWKATSGGAAAADRSPPPPGVALMGLPTGHDPHLEATEGGQA